MLLDYELKNTETMDILASLQYMLAHFISVRCEQIITTIFDYPNSCLNLLLNNHWFGSSFIGLGFVPPSQLCGDTCG